MESSVPKPNIDIYFNDFKEYNFDSYKDVQIHSIDIYYTSKGISGMEVIYMLDGN